WPRRLSADGGLGRRDHRGRRKPRSRDPTRRLHAWAIRGTRPRSRRGLTVTRPTGVNRAVAAADPAMDSQDLMDHRDVAWERVRWPASLAHQPFRYESPTRIHDLRHRLVIIPPVRHGDQRLITDHLEISSPATEVRREHDGFGNVILSLAI